MMDSAHQDNSNVSVSQASTHIVYLWIMSIGVQLKKHDVFFWPVLIVLVFALASQVTIDKVSNLDKERWIVILLGMWREEEHYWRSQQTSKQKKDDTTALSHKNAQIWRRYVEATIRRKPSNMATSLLTNLGFGEFCSMLPECVNPPSSLAHSSLSNNCCSSLSSLLINS